jgi:hypothetical protein
VVYQMLMCLERPSAQPSRDANQRCATSTIEAATAGLLDADLLGRLRPGALLVNAARGPILDTRARSITRSG